MGLVALLVVIAASAIACLIVRVGRRLRHLALLRYRLEWLRWEGEQEQLWWSVAWLPDLANGFPPWRLCPAHESSPETDVTDTPICGPSPRDQEDRYVTPFLAFR